MKKVFIKTFGCQMNEHDTTKMLLVLGAMGYSESASMEEADLVLFNTCTIREKAHHKAISEIGRAIRIKASKPEAIVGVCGCVAQQEGDALFKRYPGLDIVFGPDQLHALPALINGAGKGSRLSSLELIDDPARYRFIRDIPETHANPSAFVLAMKGCSCACSYCIVPSVRGGEISRPSDEIVDEIAGLTRLGVKEVTLLGQNVSAYRSENGRRGSGLASLIGRISKETKIERIRFTSPHPLFISDELIEEFANNEKLCQHIHLPVQAGSNKMLEKMKRGYTRELFIEKAMKLRNARPGISITTDLIVGFCGELDSDFEQTLDLMREVEFDSAFAFKYSPRPGTESAREFEDDVAQSDKEKRLDELLELQRKTSRSKNDALVGNVDSVLVVGTDRMNKGLMTGRRADNRIVHFTGNPDLIGDIVRVRVKSANDNSLQGELFNDGEKES